jgi:hypothetical protein
MSIDQHKGLGDTVAEVAKKLAIDKLANALAKAAGKEDCGCKKRQETLNNLFPYKNGNTKGSKP